MEKGKGQSFSASSFVESASSENSIDEAVYHRGRENETTEVDGEGRGRKRSEAGKKLMRLCFQFLVPAFALCTVLIGIVVSILRGIFEKDFIDDLTDIMQNIILQKVKVFVPASANQTYCM